MKILQVTNFFKPSWESGGPARVCYEISKELVNRGHEVTVYTTDGFKYRLDVVKNKPVIVDGIKVYYFRNLSNYLSRNFVLPIPYYLPFIARKEIKKFDVIHLHEYRTFLNIVVSYYARKYNVPYVLQAHGSLPHLSQKQKLKNFFDIFFGFRILKDASKLMALTKTESDQYKKMGINKNKISIIPNGINLKDYENLPEKEEFRKKYKIKKNEKIILYVGRLHKNKGLDLLVKSFSKLSKKLSNVRLVLVGPDGGYKQEIENLIKILKIKDKVLFTGFVSNKDKLRAFVDAEVFVTACFSGFPVTFLESCICGTPIITTNNGDKFDWIDDKVGYVAEYNKNQLRDAILKVLMKKKLKKKFREEGKKLVREKFNWSKIIEQIEEIYKI